MYKYLFTSSALLSLYKSLAVLLGKKIQLDTLTVSKEFAEQVEREFRQYYGERIELHNQRILGTKIIVRG